MKPDAPDMIRGEFKPIASRVPGIQVCERLPNVARIMDKVTLIRSLRHEMKNHNSAGYYSLTGYAPPTDDQRLRDTQDLFPAYGSVVDALAPPAPACRLSSLFPTSSPTAPSRPASTPAFSAKPTTRCSSARTPTAADFRLPELSLPDNLTAERLGDRRAMMRLVDEQSALLEFSARARGIDENYDKALTMLTSSGVKKAFDLSAEPEAVRDRYGRTTYGQGCLLARRLVEAGAKFVNVYFAKDIGGCDTAAGTRTASTISRCTRSSKSCLLPITDQTLPTLLEDLDERGLLDETLVVWVGEFGRSPKINAMAGRDHWPQCYTALLAGGGVKRGFVYGASDKTGAYPASDPVRPEDLSATMFHLLGVDPKTQIRDALNRPLPISTGSVIEGVLA